LLSCHSHRVFGFEAGVSVPLFTGGRIKSEIAQAEAALRQPKAEAENTRSQIDYDVRSAYLNLGAAKDQAEVARRNVDLANENLARSKDRFTSGVTTGSSPWVPRSCFYFPSCCGRTNWAAAKAYRCINGAC
jgi:outer membrane protein TolC